MSIINVSGLTVLVGLVMQNDFFIISRSFVVYRPVIYSVRVLPTVSNRRHADRGLLSDCRFLFFYCQTVFSCQL